VLHAKRHDGRPSHVRRVVSQAETNKGIRQVAYYTDPTMYNYNLSQDE
jgi:hypothetical protein